MTETTADVCRSRLGWHDWHGVIRHQRAIEHVEGLAQLCSIMPGDTIFGVMQCAQIIAKTVNSIDVSPML